MSDINILLISTIGIAVIHTITGPDHYIPFIALSKSKKWSISKTIGWTLVCGSGHVLSSVVLGLGGASIGWGIDKLTTIENQRGSIAAWGLLIFGCLYFIWGIFNAYRNKTHKHFDADNEGNMFVYEHKHSSYAAPIKKFKVTPWVIFIIFLLGPCEPMIPLLFAPAVNHNIINLITLILIYTCFTLISMVMMVLLGYWGIAFADTKKMERYMHVLAGLTLIICGAGMLFWEW
ncbi:MAG: hypothetical protein FGM46_02165 [Ferruginibacter sp.]|nr:hypothetical protein [Ferruginibacter sp.]